MNRFRKLKVYLIFPESESNILPRPTAINIEITRNKGMTIVIKVINKSL
jgi:hypothetical protein